MRLSRLRVRLLIDIFQLVYRIVRIDLCRGEAGMAQQFFHRIDVGAIVHQVRGESMPEHMRAFLIYGSDQAQVFFYRLVDIRWAEEFALLIYE